MAPVRQADKFVVLNQRAAKSPIKIGSGTRHGVATNWERIAVCNMAFIATQAEMCAPLEWITSLYIANRSESTVYTLENNSLAARENTRYYQLTAGESYVVFVLSTLNSPDTLLCPGR
jgi:hypothetical protein